ncbi:hypothetical protein [Kribbella shirazensis]|uniref:LapA family protein n=1 Tax=Kribbella shirazensis TaxID=1105143 RepID=A0A7X5ZYA7_9ACTN|nr:hypothetical protein [Kribbella shirazensis]NIK54876.1 hypothetical protein [Kribbella shirazensis]
MAVLGIVLIVLAVLFGLGVSVTSSASTTLEVFGVDFGVSVPTVYFLGALTGAALVAGLWLLKKGLGRGLRRRKEMRELRAKVTEGDGAPEVTTDRDETLADERPALGERRTEDPSETHQPH